MRFYQLTGNKCIQRKPLSRTLHHNTPHVLLHRAKRTQWRVMLPKTALAGFTFPRSSKLDNYLLSQHAPGKNMQVQIKIVHLNSVTRIPQNTPCCRPHCPQTKFYGTNNQCGGVERNGWQGGSERTT